MLSHLPNLTWLSLLSRGPPRLVIIGTEPGLGHTHSAKSCAIPCLEEPGMYQQSSFPVITFTLSRVSLGRHCLSLVMSRYDALLNNLLVTTDRFIMGSTAPSSRSSAQGARLRIAPTPLAWSVALRASRDITIQASIEYVVFVSRHSSHLSLLILRIGRSREYIDITDNPILISSFSFRILA